MNRQQRRRIQKELLKDLANGNIRQTKAEYEKAKLDRKAYYYAKKLLSGYIEDLKIQIENEEGFERVKLSLEKNRVQEEFEEISARYEKLNNKE